MLLVSLLAGWLAWPPALSTQAQEAVGQRVFTYFYYWYAPLSDDLRSIQDHADLTNHFPPDRPADWHSAAWFRQQFLDMTQAGVDVALAVYWGDHRYPETDWSTAGLEPMVQALDELADEGQPYPQIGLFLDTYILDGADVTDPASRDRLAAELRAYFRQVPDRYRATQDGRPIIWMYLSNFANGFDQQTFDTLSQELEDVLGARPFWVAEVSWAHPTTTDLLGQRHDDPTQQLLFDGFYRWGAASEGPLFVSAPLPIASVGPGYDDTAIADRGDERSQRPREAGCFYARNWRKAQSLGAQWVVIETWDELYEGSGIAHTAEWGRDYIDASAVYTSALRRGQPITLPPGCPDVPDEVDNPPDVTSPGTAPRPPKAPSCSTKRKPKDRRSPHHCP